MNSFASLVLLGVLVLPIERGGSLIVGEAFASDKEVASNDQASMEKLLSSYSKIQQALAADRLDGVKDEAGLVVSVAREIRDKKLSAKVQKAGQNVAAAAASADPKSIAKARSEFKKLSAPIAEWVKKNKPSGWNVIHCPMAGASWVQKEGQDVQNPYYGKEMLSCGEKVS